MSSNCQAIKDAIEDFKFIAARRNLNSAKYTPADRSKERTEDGKLRETKFYQGLNNS